MLANLKRILLTQYIGAIISALIGAQGLLGIVSLIVYVVSVYIEPRQRSVWGGYEGKATLEWSRVLIQSVQIILELSIAAGVVAWLYVERQPAIVESETEESEASEDSSKL